MKIIRVCFISNVNLSIGNEEEDDALKSEISLVHEIALRHNMPVTFEVSSLSATDNFLFTPLNSTLQNQKKK